MPSGTAALPSSLRYTVLATPIARILKTSPATTWLARTVTYIHAKNRFAATPTITAASRLIQINPV